MKLFYRTLLAVSLLCFLSVLVLYFAGYGGQVLGPLVVGMFLTLAIGSRGFKNFKAYAFTIWVFTAAAAGMFYPEYITNIGGYNTAGLIVPLVQVIMFGMGTALSVGDFVGVIKMPKEPEELITDVE